MAKIKTLDSAGRDIWVDENGYTYTEGGNNPTGYKFDAWNVRQGDRWDVSGDKARQMLIDKVADDISELENKLNSVQQIGLSQQDLDTFLQKAIDQVTPYYEKKATEIEAGIKEGKIRNAEDLFIKMREFDQETRSQLAGYDIEQAQTEEEFVNKLAEITSNTQDQLELKRQAYSDRIKGLKNEQVQSGILTSGIGKQEVQNVQNQQATDERIIQESGQRDVTQAETAKKYDLQKVALARENIQNERNRFLGTDSQQADTISGIKDTLGVSDVNNIGSEAEIIRQRADRNTQVYSPTAMTDLEEERKRAVESRKLSLQDEELSARREQANLEANKIYSKLNDKRSQLSYIRGF